MVCRLPLDRLVELDATAENSAVQIGADGHANVFGTPALANSFAVVPRPMCSGAGGGPGVRRAACCIAW